MALELSKHIALILNDSVDGALFGSARARGLGVLDTPRAGHLKENRLVPLSEHMVIYMYVPSKTSRIQLQAAE